MSKYKKPEQSRGGNKDAFDAMLKLMVPPAEVQEAKETSDEEPSEYCAENQTLQDT